MTGAPGADPSQRQPPLDALAQLTTRLAQVTERSAQLDIVAGVLRQLLGDVTVTFLSLQGGCWHPEPWPAAAPGSGAGSPLAADTPALRQVFEGQQPVFFGPDQPQAELNALGLAGGGALYPYVQDEQPCGLLSVSLWAGRGWNAEQRALFRAVGGALELALSRCAARGHHETLLQRLEEQAAALEVLTVFTERAAAEADVVALSREAYAVMDAHFAEHSSAYYEIRDGRWKALTWTTDMTAEQIALIQAGLPLDVPSFARALQTRQPVFIDGWDAAREQVRHTEVFGPVCIYPLVTGQEVRGIFTVGLRVGEQWQDRDRGLMRALGRSLNLALGRGEGARQQAEQNAELLARTRALEAFETLSQELDGDPHRLIQRALEIILAQLPPGFALYYELEDAERGGVFRPRVQVGSLGNDDLQRAVDAGLPYHSTHNLRRPLETGQPYYQHHYRLDTDQLGDLVRHVGATATLPILVGQQVRGVMALALFIEHKTWTATERTLLETMARSLGLALDRAEQTRQLQEERAALAAFTALTELVGSETDVLALIRQAAAVLAEAHDVDVTYSEREGEVFRIRVWPADFPGDLLAEALAGYRPTDPGFEEAQRTRQSVFLEAIDGQLDGRPGVALYHAVAFQPFFQGETMTGMLIMASRRQTHWLERERAVFLAVGRSLNLALERAEGVRRLARSNAELQVAVDELEAFAYSVSHDLRTPVRHIKGFNALLRSRLPETQDPKTGHYLKVIDDAASRMNTLIDAMLDLSRTTRQPLRVEEVDLAELVTSVQAELTPEHEERTAQWQLGPLPTVSGDRHLLRQVVINLLANALKYSRPSALPRIEIWAEEHAGEWVILVRDNGVGFDPRYAGRLFGVFQRLHHENEFEGTGVGLANVRRIVSRHGGRVDAQSPGIGHGATFSFTLPRGR